MINIEYNICLIIYFFYSIYHAIKTVFLYMLLVVIYFFYKTSNIFPGVLFSVFYLVVVIIDIYSLFNLELIYYFSTQVLLFLSILFYYKNQIPKKIMNNVYYMVVLAVLIIIALINEMYNGNYLLDKYPDIPFHVIIEVLGCILFFILCYTFLQIK